MPYASNEELPDAIKEALPTKAQDIFRAAFNAAAKKYNNESRGFKIAWAAVKNAGWRKDKSGKWRMSKHVIAKVDPDKQRVWGWASVVVTKAGHPVVDADEDIIEPEELEQAVYDFVLEFRDMGEMHKGSSKGRLIESIVFTKEKTQLLGISDGVLPVGWWVGFYVEDKTIFEKIKSGQMSMFSIQGRAERINADAA